MIIARTIKTESYVCKADRENPSEEQTKFMLKTLSAQDVASFQDSLLVDGKTNFSITSMHSLLKQSLVGWENFTDESNGQVKFDRKDSSANLDRIPQEVIMELCEHIMATNFPDPEGKLEKN